MLYSNKIKFGFLIMFIVLFSMISCKKDGYVTDGGLANAQSDLSTYDYLAKNQYAYFDTLIQIIDHYNLKDSVNKAGSFFAPTDFSINRTMQALNYSSLDMLYDSISSKFITQYIFSDKNLTLDNATISVKVYTNWANTTAGVNKLAATYFVGATSFPYYILQYVKINGFLDSDPNKPTDDETDIMLQCQTTGIQTATGTNLNVLSNKETLSKF